jgi:thiol-disulfide isomerase/thioredoxin
MSPCLLAGFLLIATQPMQAGEHPTNPNPMPTLKLGDPAPALRATKWLQGEEIRELERGKIYVVEFWATWCGWCIVYMSHSAELQAQYKNHGVTFIYYSARDPNNTEEKVSACGRPQDGRPSFARTGGH